MIINADDFGKSPSVNRAIVKCFQDGLISRTTIMANMPYFDEAVELSKKNGFFDKVGLHLNLDEGKPLSEEMSGNKHFCRDGILIDGIFNNSSKKIWLGGDDLFCVKSEIEAQMRKYVDAGFTLFHIDSHRFVHNNISVLMPTINLAKKNGFVSMRIMELNLNDGMIKRMYKVLLNRYIKMNFHTSDQFVQNISNFIPSKGTAEYMSHPDYINGDLVDIISWNPIRTVPFINNQRLISL